MYVFKLIFKKFLLNILFYQAEIRAEETNPPPELVALASVEDEIEITNSSSVAGSHFFLPHIVNFWIEFVQLMLNSEVHIIIYIPNNL